MTNTNPYSSFSPDILARLSWLTGGLSNPQYTQAVNAQAQPAQAPMAQKPAANPMNNPNLQAYLQRLSMQGTNALNGGILGYQPQSFSSGMGQQSQAPSGLLGQFAARPWNQGGQ